MAGELQGHKKGEGGQNIHDNLMHTASESAIVHQSRVDLEPAVHVKESEQDDSSLNSIAADNSMLTSTANVELPQPERPARRLSGYLGRMLSVDSKHKPAKSAMKVTAQTATGNEISVHDNQGNDPSVPTKVHLAKLRRESMARDKSKLARFGTGSRKLIRVGVPGGKKVNFESELSALFTWSGSSLQAALTSHTLYGHVLLYLVFTMVFVYVRLYHDGITSYNGKWPDSVISAFQFITVFTISFYTNQVWLSQIGSTLSICIHVHLLCHIVAHMGQMLNACSPVSALAVVPCVTVRFARFFFIYKLAANANLFWRTCLYVPANNDTESLFLNFETR